MRVYSANNALGLLRVHKVLLFLPEVRKAKTYLPPRNLIYTHSKGMGIASLYDSF
jgi:hypothetical protein